MNSIYYYKEFFLILFSLFFAIFFMIIWLIKLFIYRFRFHSIIERFLITTNILILYFLSPIINMIADFFNCTELNGNTYMTNYLLERCNNNETYDLWRNALIFPSFAFYVIIFPLIFCFFIYKNKKQLFGSNVMSKIGFVLQGYTSKTYYWYYI